jgi:hypothetical protein
LALPLNSQNLLKNLDSQKLAKPVKMMNNGSRRYTAFWRKWM